MSLTAPSPLVPRESGGSAAVTQPSLLEQKLNRCKPGRWGMLAFALVVLAEILYVSIRLHADLSSVPPMPTQPYLLLGLALVVALGFEFVNGFHDTANAVATVIYTHSLEPHIAVLWSGFWNFIGVLLSSGMVAYAIVALLPVQLVLRMSHGTGFSMIFALLTAAIIWNLGTWLRGLPASSSHTMIGSVLGVGLANQLMMGGSGMDGVDWESVLKVIRALIFSPIIGFVGAAMLFGLCKLFLRDPKFFKAPEGDQPPPWPVRALLILTCTGVSYAHGSNDGQKGMGLIMLILVGSVPTAYALNHAVDERSVQRFVQVSTQVADSLSPYVPTTYTADPGGELERFVSTRKLQPETVPALQSMIRKVSSEITGNGSLAGVPAGNQGNVRNQMYLVSGTLRLLPKYGPKLPDGASAQVWKSYKGFLDSSTLYIPIWVKVTVALTLGLGTMVGWKRIVVTVGEKIGKQHLTYAQGAAAELMAMATILGADRFGLPVSTTHVLSSGVAGAMAANGSGLQRATVRNIALAWFFTLPVSALLSGVLFWAFQHIHVSL